MRKSIRIALLMCTTALYPGDAFAMPPVLGFLGGFLAQFGFITPLIGFGTIAAVNAGFAAAAFLASGIGSLLLSAGATALQFLLAGGRRQQAPSVDAAKINVRIGEPERWIHAGVSRAGGGALFGEFDASGTFWFIIVHGDSELLSTVNVMLDDRVAELDSNGWVLNDDFCLTTEGDAYSGSGTRVPFFQVRTTTYTPTNPIPPAIGEFKSAFPEWTDEHVLAGTTFSVVKCVAADPEDRHKVYRWRGVFQLGEPSVSIVGRWSRCYDPRNPFHDIDDPSTWTYTRNPVLIWAWFRTHPYGRNKPMSSVNWEKVAEQADICDQDLLDKDGNTVNRYECGISIPESKERAVAEQEIMLSCDGQIMFDSTGKSWLRVGYYEVPTLTLTGTRDIVAMASQEATNGESETDGVIVRYIDPLFNYQPQPAAAWVNPLHYVEGTTPRYLKVDILACQNHNQAMRLAKAIGLRSQSLHRLAPTTSLRGLKARQERIIDLQYDETFSGDYEIAVPVEVDQSGAFCSFGVVPVDPNRWDLLPGEEQSKPPVPVVIPPSGTPVLPTNVTVYAAPVAGSGGSAVRIEATFDASPRPDHRYEFQYRLQDETIWRDMTVQMDDLLAYSGVVPNSETHSVRWRTRTSAGRVSAYSDIVEVEAVADTTAPGPVTGVSGTGGAGTIDYGWTAPNSANYLATRIYRSATDDIGTAALEAVEYGAPNASDTFQETGVAAGTWYAWLVAINGSGVAAAEVATGAITVT